MTTRPAIVAAVLVCALAAGGCDGSDDRRPGAATDGGVTLQDLAATGYASHDPAATVPGGASAADAGAVAPGWNLFTDQVDTVLALDADGVELLRRTVPGRSQVEHAEPVAAGLLTVSVDQGWDLLDADGAHVWSVDGNAHHDVAERPGGGYWALAWEERRYRGRRVRFDVLLHLPADGGQPRRTWSSFDAREALRAFHPALPLDRAEAPDDAGDDVVYDYHHLNTVEVLAVPRGEAAGARALLADDPRFRPGHLLLCARNASLVFVLDPESGRVTWSFGPAALDFPHTPTLTPRGTVLVFDNGWHRGWSRALELDPVSGAVVWSYEADPRVDFFTRTRGSAQRLENGNTLLCEAERGHAFEVTTEGALVWSLRNPLEPDAVGGEEGPGGARRRRFYRLTRVLPERLGR